MATLMDRMQADRLPSKNGDGKPKVERYDWTSSGEPCALAWVDKRLLLVDHEYQRESVVEAKVHRISADFCWHALNVISCAVRDVTPLAFDFDGRRVRLRPFDGLKLWVMDGQHRKLGADRRTDIRELPCAIFHVSHLAEEAEAFLRINKDRSTVTAIQKFNALVAAGDQATIATKELAAKYGYTVGQRSGKGALRCIGTVTRAMQIDPAATERVFEIAATLYDGEPPDERVFGGMFVAERHLGKCNAGSLIDSHNWDSIMGHGPQKIKEAMRQAQVMYKGGDKTSARGLIALLNQRRRSRLLPEITQGGSDE